MRGDNYDGPARSVYEALRAHPPLTADEYTGLIEQLAPLYLDEVVCPVQVAARQLRQAVNASASDDVDQVVSAHRAARARLYDALWNAGLLTLDEELQELSADVAADPSDETPAMRTKTTDRLGMRQWQAWRTDEEPP